MAIQLFRIYGHDIDNGRIFFNNDGYEVDFYIPDDELAIQVCYSLHDEETRKRGTKVQLFYETNKKFNNNLVIW